MASNRVIAHFKLYGNMMNHTQQYCLRSHEAGNQASCCIQNTLWLLLWVKYRLPACNQRINRAHMTRNHRDTHHSFINQQYRNSFQAYGTRSCSDLTAFYCLSHTVCCIFSHFPHSVTNLLSPAVPASFYSQPCPQAPPPPSLLLHYQTPATPHVTSTLIRIPHRIPQNLPKLSKAHHPALARAPLSVQLEELSSLQALL